MKCLLALLLCAMAPLAMADQYSLPYGWTGGNGLLGQCLTSNGSLLPPSFQACSGGGGGGDVTLNGTQTLTNKTIDGASNTLLNIPAAQLVGSLNVSALSGQLGVANGGTNLASGLSGGLLYFSGTGTIASSAALTANALMLGGGVGNAPGPMGSLGTTITLLHGNASGAPTFGPVNFATEGTGLLPVANGGSGVGTLTGPIKGNGTSAFTAAAATDMVGLFSGGSATSSYYLAGDGTKQLIASGAAGGNPTATTGLTAVNGSANTFLRSDGAPALDQSITPTWTGNHTWSKVEPRLIVCDTGGGTNGKCFDIDVTPTLISIRTRTDADGAGVTIFSATRTGSSTAITGIALGAPITVSGSGTSTLTGQATADKFNATAATSSSCPANGMYLPAGNTLGFCSNTAERYRITSAGISITAGGLNLAGTKPTVTGCTNSATLGGATAGQYTSGTTGTCSVTLTLPAATNGYSCWAHDETTAADYVQAATTSSTTLSITGTTVSGDIVKWGCILY
jgi:hypothetical protein